MYNILEQDVTVNKSQREAGSFFASSAYDATIYPLD